MVIPNDRNKKEEGLSIKFQKLLPFIVTLVLGTCIGLSIVPILSPYFTFQNNAYYPSKMCSSIHQSHENYTLDSFLSPRGVMHDMSDKELLWKASLVPKRDVFPFKRVPKVAFMFLVRGPLPLMELWELFFQGHEGLYSIYVHSLPSYKLNVNQTSPFYGRQIKGQRSIWGSISLLDAERRLLANALLDFSNERFVLLSESCVPLYNFQTIYNYLINSNHSFVQSYDDYSARGRGRYRRNMWPHINISDWRKGSEWFELNRGLAISIVADSKYYMLFYKYCTPTCYPDEHYIPTYINMFHGHLNSNRTLTWVDWSKAGPHPGIYGHKSINVDFILSIRNNVSDCLYNFKLTNVCFLFARKFAPNALPPLLRLAKSLMKF